MYAPGFIVLQKKDSIWIFRGIIETLDSDMKISLHLIEVWIILSNDLPGDWRVVYVPPD